MCGRYTLTTTDGPLVAERFGAHHEVTTELLHRFNVCPTEPVLAVDNSHAARSARWGLTLPRARAFSPINVRAETAATRPLFSKLIANASGRCLVPADGWYEWLRAEQPKVKPAPMRYTVDGGELFAFAGLLKDDSLAILTTEPNELCARVHDRMPCVLAGPAEEAAWLDPDIDSAAALELLGPLDAARIAVAPASPRVNRAGTEGADLLAPDPALF